MDHEYEKTSDKGCGCAHIRGICCDVKNCVHHDSHDCCTAKEITVGPSYASTSSDTACVTFKPKDIAVD